MFINLTEQSGKEYSFHIDFPHPLLEEAWKEGRYQEGSTEPWTQQLIVSLAKSIGATRILETGTFLGHTTLWLALELKHLIISLDSDEKRAGEAADLLHKDISLLVPPVIIHADALDYLQKTNMPFDFAFLDDNHEAEHVDREIELLKPKMKKGGLICVHDVFGPFGLAGVVSKYHGFNLDLPKIHVGGGLGIIQV